MATWGNKTGKAELKKLSERKCVSFREEKNYAISTKPLFDSFKILLRKASVLLPLHYPCSPCMKLKRSRLPCQLLHFLCVACLRALGMEKGSIKDAQITASSQYSSYYAATNARLHHSTAGWGPLDKDAHAFLQVDLGKEMEVTGINTQGCSNGAYWVRSYTISYGNDGTHFQNYEKEKVWRPLKIAARRTNHSIIVNYPKTSPHPHL